MAGKVEVHVDFGGVGRIMRSADMASVIRAKADALAAELRARGVDGVSVDSYTTDRAAAAVTVSGDAAGQEAKRGLISDAARAVGLEVRQ